MSTVKVDGVNVDPILGKMWAVFWAMREIRMANVRRIRADGKEVLKE